MLWKKKEDKVTPRELYLMRKVIRRWNKFMDHRKNVYDKTHDALSLTNLIDQFPPDNYDEMKEKYMKAIFEKPKNYVIL